MNIQPISIVIEFTEATAQPIGTANRNLIREGGFRFLYFAFDF